MQADIAELVESVDTRSASGLHKLLQGGCMQISICWLGRLLVLN